MNGLWSDALATLVYPFTSAKKKSTDIYCRLRIDFGSQPYE